MWDVFDASSGDGRRKEALIACEHPTGWAGGVFAFSGRTGVKTGTGPPHQGEDACDHPQNTPATGQTTQVMCQSPERKLQAR